MPESIRIAVMADIHSNYEAFKTCVNKTEKTGICNYIFLGDYLGDMAYPQKTLQLMQYLKEKYNCVFIRGNKEEYWINHRKNKDEKWELGNSGSGMLCYNYENLFDEDIDFFEKIPISLTIKYEGYPEFTVCHGSPFRVNQSMRSDHNYIDELTAKLPTKLTICGHSHYREDYIRNNNRVINPGSVGLPLGCGRAVAQFMILNGHGGLWEPEFLSLPYDIEKTIAEMDEEKLYEKAPCWYKMTKHMLMTGDNLYVAAIRKAKELYFNDTGITIWKDFPEEYWERALGEFGI